MGNTKSKPGEPDYVAVLQHNPDEGKTIEVGDFKVQRRHAVRVAQGKEAVDVRQVVAKIPSKRPSRKPVSMLGFKVADYARNAQGTEPLLNVYVMVWLEVKLGEHCIRQSHRGDPVNHAGQIRPGVKYCTQNAHVMGIQFLGRPDRIQQALQAYRSNQGYVVSKFDGTFHYNVEQPVTEKDFGQPGKGGCIQGVHFYPDFVSATEFGGCGDCREQFPVITRTFRQPRTGSVEAIPDEAFRPSMKRSIHPTIWKTSQLAPVDWIEILK